MRTNDLYSRLLLTLIAGSLLYIAGTLRTLVRQADTYVAQATTRPAATPVSWNPAPPAQTPMRVLITGYSIPRVNNPLPRDADWLDFTLNRQGLPVTTVK